MKKLFAIVMLLLLLCLPVMPMGQTVSSAQENEIVITADYTYLYKNPDKSERFDLKINSGEILPCLDVVGNFYHASYIYNEETYSGYIWMEHASMYRPDQEIIFEYNATIIKDETPVYPLEGEVAIEGISLASGTRIYLYEGYSRKKEFLPARFIYNGHVVTAKVAMNAVKPDGVNKALIISITAIIAIVGVVLILLGLKQNKWHKRLKNAKK